MSLPTPLHDLTDNSRNVVAGVEPSELRRRITSKYETAFGDAFRQRRLLAIFARSLLVRIALILLAVDIFECRATASQVFSLDIVALSGAEAPGVEPHRFFGQFNPVLNDRGDVAFLATLGNGPDGAAGQHGLWLSKPSGIEMVALGGHKLPGHSTEDAVLERLTRYVLNDNGDVAFVSQRQARTPLEPASQLWTYFGGAYDLVVDSRQQAPAAPIGSRIEGLGNVRFSNSGQLAYSATLSVGEGGITADNNQGVWTMDAGAVSLLARTGDVASGAAGMATYFDFGDVALSDSGVTAIEVWLDLPVMGHPSTGRQKGVWITSAFQELLPLARTFDSAPGAATTFSGFADVTTAGNGRVAFRSAFPEHVAGPTELNNQGVWAQNDAGELQLVSRSGMPAPGTPPSVFFEYFGAQVVNSAGDMAFYGHLWNGSGDVDAGVNSTGVWMLDRHGELKLIVRNGDPAPGFAEGVMIDSISDHGFALNEFGQLAFQAVLSTGGSAVWATDRNFELQRILGRGDAVELAPGDARTVSLVSFRSGEGSGAGLSNGFNNLGQLALSIHFLDGTSGVFVSNAVAVPEVAASIAMLQAIIAMIGWQCRRPAAFVGRCPDATRRAGWRPSGQRGY